MLDGSLRIDFRDGAVQLSAGEMFVVPKGIEHKPYAEREVKLLLVEPRGVRNTGHAGGARTAHPNGGYERVYEYDADGRVSGVIYTGPLFLAIKTRTVLKEFKPGSEAERLGLKLGDFFVSYDGRPVLLSDNFAKELNAQPKTHPARPLVVLRKNETVTIQLTTSARKITKRIPDNSMVAGKVRNQASSKLRTVPNWMPDRSAAMVPATPEAKTCVVLTGRP